MSDNNFIKISKDCDGILIPSGDQVKLKKGIIRHIGLRENREKYMKNHKTDYVTGCCMIMHKDVFLKLGGFDDRFFMYNEDVDFCLRAKSLGIKSKFLSTPIVFHKVSLSVGGNYSIKKIWMKIKSGYQLYRKYYSFHKAITFMILYIIKTIFPSFFNGTSFPNQRDIIFPMEPCTCNCKSLAVDFLPPHIFMQT